MPLNLFKIMMLFSDSSAQYARYFDSEVCPFSWSEIKMKELWTPKETSQQQQYVRDWRGRYVQKKKNLGMQCNIEKKKICFQLRLQFYTATL